MEHMHQHDLQVLRYDGRLAALFQMLEDLHTAASDGSLQGVTPLTDAELLEWLHECIYTAQETITEIEKARTRGVAPHLRLVK